MTFLISSSVNAFSWRRIFLTSKTLQKSSKFVIQWGVTVVCNVWRHPPNPHHCSMKELEKDMTQLRNGMKECGREVTSLQIVQPP